MAGHAIIGSFGLDLCLQCFRQTLDTQVLELSAQVFPEHTRPKQGSPRRRLQDLGFFSALRDGDV